MNLLIFKLFKEIISKYNINIKYNCKRCGYSTNIKCNLITHFDRKKQCESILEDIDIETLRQELVKPVNKITVQTVHDLSKDVSNLSENVSCLSEDVSSMSEDVSSLSEDVCKKSENTIKMIGSKYQCSECKKLFKEKNYGIFQTNNYHPWRINEI